MTNGTGSSLWCQPPNPEKESVVNRSRWIGAVCSTPSFTWSERAVPGGFCPVTLVRGRPSMVTSGFGAKTGRGSSFTTFCVTVCAKPKAAGWPRRRPSWTANRSRPRTRREHAATMRARSISGRKRHVAVDCLGLILAMMITPAGVQDRDAARPLIKTLVRLYGRLQIIWADGGYLGALVNWVKQLRPFGKLRLEVVRRCDDVKGFKVLPRRWVVERTFGWLFKSRRLCRDYEVRLDHSEAMIRICMIRIMVRRLAAT